MGLLVGKKSRAGGALVGFQWLLIGACVCALGCGASTSASTNGGGGGGTSNVPDDDGNDVVADNDGGDDAKTDTNPALLEDDIPDSAPAPKVRVGPEFPTSKPPAQLSDFLVKPAQAAVNKKKWALAISYYQGLVVARGPASDEALELVRALTQENQYGEALAVLDDFIATTQDPEKHKQQQEVRERLAQNNNPFSRTFKPQPAMKEAGEAFELGRKAFKAAGNAKKKDLAAKLYGDAVLYFQMGLALAPDLPGFLRELGATYDKLGATAKKVEYLSAYLRRRPFGKNADDARKLLGKNHKAVGALTIDSALPCDEVWLNNQLVTYKLPIKGLVLGPGRYTALCYNIQYDIAYFEDATVQAGKPATLKFDWAIVVNGLTNPNGRIRVENILSRGDYVSVPLSKQDGFGIVVPSDGRALEFRLESLARDRQETRLIKVAPGSKEVIKW